MTNKTIEFLTEEYDKVTKVSENVYECYLAYIDETHTVKDVNGQLWAYANNHSWLVN